jgi:hypothetical protein
MCVILIRKDLEPIQRENQNAILKEESNGIAGSHKKEADVQEIQRRACA